MSSDGVKFVDKNQTGCVLFRGSEKIPNPGAADTDKQFNKL
jgi:hypothetical protein